MKITTFNPQIVTKDPEPVLKTFEALGFEKRHELKGIGEKEVTGIRMKSPDGFYLDISVVGDIPVTHDLVGIRMNVDDFEEAYNLLISQGFKNVYGDKTVDLKKSRSAMLISPTGYGINLVKHIKE